MSPAEAIASSLESVFQRIEQAAMEGVPILNPALSVKAVGLREWGDEWLAVLITPWFMNLALLPRAGAEAPLRVTTGTKEHVVFPAGRFEFIHAFEDELGPYRMCSLFSPVFEFADQETAEATARHVLAELFSAPADDDEDRDMVRIWEGRLPEEETAMPADEADASSTGPEDGSPAPAESVAMTRRSLLGLRGAGEAGG